MDSKESSDTVSLTHSLSLFGFSLLLSSLSLSVALLLCCSVALSTLFTHSLFVSLYTHTHSLSLCSSYRHALPSLWLLSLSLDQCLLCRLQRQHTYTHSLVLLSFPPPPLFFRISSYPLFLSLSLTHPSRSLPLCDFPLGSQGR